MRARPDARFTLWRGPSVLDGKPIMVLLTLASENRKIGDMAQVWILRDRISPVQAVQTNGDVSICGDCPLKGDGGRARGCYVVAHQASLQVWKQARLGKYPPLPTYQYPAVLAGRLLRLAAYGDPAAVPVDVWRPLLAAVRGWTGYTHQWRRPDAEPLRAWLMASVESVAEAAEAHARGWRVFYARPGGVPAPVWAITCPASTEAKARGIYATCASCRLCNGGARTMARSVTIAAHGSGGRYLR